MNPSTTTKGGCMAARYGSWTTSCPLSGASMAFRYGGNSNSTCFRSSFGTYTFSPYACCEQVKAWHKNLETNLNLKNTRGDQDLWDHTVESSLNWILKNHVNDCLYQGVETSLRRSLVEVKNYKEMYTGQMVRFLLLQHWTLLIGKIHPNWQLKNKVNNCLYQEKTVWRGH